MVHFYAKHFNPNKTFKFPLHCQNMSHKIILTDWFSFPEQMFLISHLWVSLSTGTPSLEPLGLLLWEWWVPLWPLQDPFGHQNSFCGCHNHGLYTLFSNFWPLQQYLGHFWPLKQFLWLPQPRAVHSLGKWISLFGHCRVLLATETAFSGRCNLFAEHLSSTLWQLQHH